MGLDSNVKNVTRSLIEYYCFNYLPLFVIFFLSTFQWQVIVFVNMGLLVCNTIAFLIRRHWWEWCPSVDYEHVMTIYYSNTPVRICGYGVTGQQIISEPNEDGTRAEKRNRTSLFAFLRTYTVTVFIVYCVSFRFRFSVPRFYLFITRFPRVAADDVPVRVRVGNSTKLF